MHGGATPLTCSSPPGRAADPRACDGGRAATAAPWPAAAARLTGRAWPAAGEPQTWGAAGLQGAPVGTEHLDGEEKKRFRPEGSVMALTGQKVVEGEQRPYRRRGGVASRARAAAGR